MKVTWDKTTRQFFLEAEERKFFFVNSINFLVRALKTSIKGKFVTETTV